MELSHPARDGACKACPLHEQCKTVCIPSVRADGHPWPETRLDCKRDRAIFIIGEAPGYNEDMTGEPWVGKAGKLLRTAYVDFFKLHDLADVYLSNAVRCRPPGNATPNKTQLKACQGFYLADLVHLQSLYDQVVVLCAGGVATQSVLGTSLKKSLSRQGDFTDFRALTAKTPKSIIRLGEVVGPYLDDPTSPPFSTPCRVFSTNHSAAVLRDKNKGLLVRAHMQMLVDYMNGKLEYDFLPEQADIQYAPSPPSYAIPILSLDIETYGILDSFKPHPSQTKQFFQPLKSVEYDGILRDRLVVTTGLTWWDPDGTERHGIFIMHKPSHRRRLWSWLKKLNGKSSTSTTTLRPSTSFLLGQNIKFDVSYLRHAYPECKTWLNHPLALVDLSITNYLHNEGRAERSLKELAPLLRVTKYGATFQTYPTPEDRSLHQYNIQDTSATLRCQVKLEEAISQVYGRTTPKLSEFNRQWYSQLLWLVIWMEEAGISMDECRLRKLLDLYEARLTRLEKAIHDRWGIKLTGKGSEKAKRQVMADAVKTLQESKLPIPKLEKTAARKELSFKEENRNVLLDALPAGTPSYRQLRAITRVHSVKGTLDRYLYPLLVGRGSGHSDPSTRLIRGIAYPRWYPVPSEWEDGSSGGTKQCRIVAKGPACQTFPPTIKKCITSRYDYLIWFDYSQIELRIAALLSNDPWMMGEYSKPDCDFHLATAARLFGDADAQRYRQIGKTLNFLVIYLGGPHQYQRTLMRDVGIARSIEQCADDINKWWALATGLSEWQHETFESVVRNNYFQLPLAGQSRLYMGKRHDVLESMKEIVNMPVQAEAANVMLSSQFELQWEFKRRGMKSVLPINVYDAAAIEVPRAELGAVKKALATILPNPPYYQALCEKLGRTLPLEIDTKITEVVA